jgi:hypothetical protein
MRTKKISNRVRLDYDRDSLTITVRGQRHWLIEGFLLIWLTGWTIAGVEAWRVLLFSPLEAWPVKLFMLVWLAGWATGEFVFGSIFLWMLAGRERLRLSPRGCRLRWEVLGLGRQKEWRAHEVRQFHENLQSDEESGRKPGYDGSGAIGFKAGEKHQAFGAGLERSELQLVLQEVQAFWGQR